RCGRRRRARRAKNPPPPGMGEARAPPADAVTPGPAEARLGLAFRTVFAADPARVTELVEQIEQVRVVDLADIRLVPAGIAGDLHMRVMPGERANAVGE